MELYKLGEMEQKFAEIIWAHAPIPSGQLVKLCKEAFNWKRTTTYTMLKRLCLRKLFVNNNGVVSVVMSKEDFQAARGEQFLNENFNGSLPCFLAAFSKRKKLNHQEIEELQKLIDNYKEDTNG